MLRSLGVLLSGASLLLAAGELSNRPAPDFRLPDSQGRTVSLADFKGKFVVVEFLSTTCPHCQKFVPVLETMQKRFKGRVAVIGIATHPDNAATAAQFIQTYKVTYPILLDLGHRAAMSYLRPPPPNYSFSIPHVFLIDRTGYIRDDFIQNPSNTDYFTPEGFAHLIEGYLGRR